MYIFKVLLSATSFFSNIHTSVCCVFIYGCCSAFVVNVSVSHLHHVPSFKQE